VKAHFDYRVALTVRIKKFVDSALRRETGGTNDIVGSRRLQCRTCVIATPLFVYTMM
jgi:hypothetical protein